MVFIFFEVIYDLLCFSCNLIHLFFREATSLRNPVKTSTLQQGWPLNYKWSQCPIGRGKKKIFLSVLFKLCDLLDSLKIIKHVYSWDIWFLQGDLKQAFRTELGWRKELMSNWNLNFLLKCDCRPEREMCVCIYSSCSFYELVTNICTFVSCYRRYR